MHGGAAGWIRPGTDHAMTKGGGFGFEVAVSGGRDFDGLAFSKDASRK